MTQNDNRTAALFYFQAGIAAADPYGAVVAHAESLAKPDLIIAVGKAARKMAQAALSVFPGVPTRVVTNYENAHPLDGAEVMAAGHPVPDENGVRAARAVIADLNAATGSVLALISGGGSALLPAPVDGITFADKAAVNSLLLGSGLDIVRMNLVRQQLSQLKGGGMLRAAKGPVTALILSDVVGDDLSAVASGPTVPPLANRKDARTVLEGAGLWHRVPESVRAHLAAPQAITELPRATNILIGSNSQSLQAMHAACPKATVIADPVEGDVAEAARLICAASGVGVTFWGGETTVVLKGNGRGGRNQELALRIAIEAQRLGWSNWTCLQGGSDGRDGPTDAAGGLVDHGTLARIAAAGGDLAALLANNDSYVALEMAGDLLKIDATGTNVADLGIMIRDN